MKTPQIFIVDTNVLVAGLLSVQPGSPTVNIVDAMIDGRLFFLLSAELLKEYRSVLLRPKLLRLHGLSDQQVALFLTEITANAIWCKKISTLKEQPPDPGDCHLWQLLATEPSAVLVTGDRLLLENPPRENSVISPADCALVYFW